MYAMYANLATFVWIIYFMTYIKNHLNPVHQNINL